MREGSPRVVVDQLGREVAQALVDGETRECGGTANPAPDPPADPKTPLASPLYGDLKGLPPMLVQVGTAETMYDDSRLYAEKAQAAGVDITFEPWEDMIHGWHGSAAVLPEAQEAIDSVGAYFRSRIP